MTEGALEVRTHVGSRRPLPRAFYENATTLVARLLLGAILDCHTSAGRAAGRIVETEAYLGPTDPASHASVGLTARTRHLFGMPGTSYVYFIYGVHWCVNAVTEAPGTGRAVLIRAIEPIDGITLMRQRRRATDGQRPDRELTNGPGKLCAALGITGELSGLTLQRSPLTIRRGSEVDDHDVRVSPRVGITRAAEPLRRFFVRDNPYVSRTPPRFPVLPYSASLIHAV